MAELTSQVKILEDEVALLKGEIKAILTEIRTAVLSRDNPFTAGGGGGFSDDQHASAATPQSPSAEPQALAPEPPAPTPGIPDLTISLPMTDPQQQPPAVPPWAGAIPSQQPAPAPFMPGPPQTPGAPAPPPVVQGPQVVINAPGATPSPPGAGAEAPPVTPPSSTESRSDPAPSDGEPEDEETSNEPIPIRSNMADDVEASEPQRERPAWSLPALAGLAVWAEDSLASLGPRRFHFVLDLATFSGLLSPEAREVLSGLIDADSLSHEEERPLNVNECLVVLRQLDAIVHGEKIMKLPRRRGIRHRRVR